MSTIREDLNESLKLALKAGDKIKVTVVRSILAAVQNADKATKELINDDKIVETIAKLSKNLKEAAAEMQDGHKVKESYLNEIDILEQFLPDSVEEQELIAKVDDVINELADQSKKAMGIVIKNVRSFFHGRLVDAKKLSDIVKDKLK